MKGFGAIEFLLVIIIIVTFGLVTIGSWVSAGYKADVWNRCHPEVPITQAEAWWITDLQLDECEVPTNESL